MIALDEGASWRLSPRSDRAWEWLKEKVAGKRDASGSVVVKEAARLLSELLHAGLRVQEVH